MKININPVRSVALRTTTSTSFDGGEYLHAEAALIDSLADKDYTTAVGVAFRRDEMSETAKKNREALVDAAKKGTAEYDKVYLEQSCRSVSTTDTDAKRLAVQVEKELATA